MKYLITGANGFLGKHLCRYFDQTNVDYVACVRSAQSPKEATCGDLLEFHDWPKLFQDIHVIIHLAAKVHDFTRKQYADYKIMNVDLTKQIATEAKKSGVKRFVFISSIKVNGERTTAKPFAADDTPAPEDPYAHSKLEAEQELLKMNDTNFEVVIIRPALVYGENVKGNFSRLVSLIKTPIPLPFGLINNKRSFISVSNLTHLIKLASEHPKAAGQIFLASDGNDLSTKTLIYMISKILKIHTTMLPIPMKFINFILKIFNVKYYEDRLFSNLQIDIRKTKKMLGWSPPFSVVQSLKIMLEPHYSEFYFKTKPKIAVLLATHNGIKFLNTQIRSILNQTNVDVTLFVSDDFSTDGTWEYLNGLKSPQIILLERIAQYNSAGENFFRLLKDVSFTSFDYVSLSDQDDIWFDDKLITGITELRNENAEACSSDIIAYWENQETEKHKKKYIKKSRPIGKWNHLFESAGPGCTYLLKETVATEFSVFLKDKNCDISAIKNTHDWVLFSFVSSKNYKWLIIDVPTMLYRQHLNNAFGVNVGFTNIIRRFKMLLNGWYLNEVYSIAKVCRNAESEPLVKLKQYSITNFSYLITNLRHMRRNNIDRIVLFAYFLLVYIRPSLRIENNRQSSGDYRRQSNK